MVEMNMANFRGIDTVRELIRNASLRPLMGDVRVWILDEIQSGTKDAQQALLKLLEDAPKHSYFLLATTDPDKLLPTIRSRCAIFKTSPLSDRVMLKLLNRISDAEDKQVPDSVLDQIVKDSVGHPRAALVMLDKIIDLPQDRMLKAVEKVAAEENQAIDLCRALLRKDKWQKVRELVKGLETEDPESLRRMVLAYCSTVMLNEDNPRAYLILDAFRNPFYDTGKAALILACYEAVQ